MYFGISMCFLQGQKTTVILSVAKDLVYTPVIARSERSERRGNLGIVADIHGIATPPSGLAMTQLSKIIAKSLRLCYGF